jgi:hypothetical protein
MEKTMYWLVRWPWIGTALVSVLLAQLAFGPWYISAWFVLGALMLAMTVTRAERTRLQLSLVLAGSQPAA